MSKRDLLAQCCESRGIGLWEYAVLSTMGEDFLERERIAEEAISRIDSEGLFVVGLVDVGSPRRADIEETVERLVSRGHLAIVDDDLQALIELRRREGALTLTMLPSLGRNCVGLWTISPSGGRLLAELYQTSTIYYSWLDSRPDGTCVQQYPPWAVPISRERLCPRGGLHCELGQRCHIESMTGEWYHNWWWPIEGGTRVVCRARTERP